MNIISTGAADILLVDLPEGSNRFQIFNDRDKPYLSFFVGVDTFRIYLREGYNYTILDRFESLSEEQYVELMPCGDHIEGLGYFMPCYGYFGYKHYLTAKEALTCFLQYEKGIVWQEVKNPLVIKAEKIT